MWLIFNHRMAYFKPTAMFSAGILVRCYPDRCAKRQAVLLNAASGAAEVAVAASPPAHDFRRPMRPRKHENTKKKSKLATLTLP